MSTRCNIYLKINDEDKNKSFTNGDNLLILKGNYVGIYCHHDGYIDGVGHKLINFYNTYEKALSLIVPGDCSSIHENGASYYTEYGDEYNSVKPKMSECFPDIKEDYLYVFFDGEWRVYTKTKYNGQLVREILNNNKNGK